MKNFEIKLSVIGALALAHSDVTDSHLQSYCMTLFDKFDALDRSKSL